MGLFLLKQGSYFFDSTVVETYVRETKKNPLMIVSAYVSGENNFLFRVN